MHYLNDVGGVRAEQLEGFFVDWPNPPDPETHLRILKNSFRVCLAFDGERCVGFINALSDGVFYAYLPLLEVLPDYQGRGIGKRLVEKMVSSLRDMYAIDVCCDANVTAFYERQGFMRSNSMIRRNYGRQSGQRLELS